MFNSPNQQSLTVSLPLDAVCVELESSPLYWTTRTTQLFRNVYNLLGTSLAFMKHLTDRRLNKRFKRDHEYSKPQAMNFFSTFSSASSQYLSAPLAPIRQRSQNLKPRDDLDEFLSSDLEHSFASTMSLNSPSRDYVNISQDDAMDISPMPSHVSRKESVQFSKPTTRPRAYTSGARMFGQDLSNNSISNNSISDLKSGTRSGSKCTQHTALPVEWFHAKPLECAQTSDDNLFAPVSVHTLQFVLVSALNLVLSAG